jgi:hypothetical protein
LTSCRQRCACLVASSAAISAVPTPVVSCNRVVPAPEPRINAVLSLSQAAAIAAAAAAAAAAFMFLLPCCCCCSGRAAVSTAPIPQPVQAPLPL